MEGIGYEYSLYVDRIRSITGEAKRWKIRVVGGGGKSSVWNQIKSDILDMSYETVEREDVSILGQAIIAAVGVGDIKNLQSAIRRVVNTGTIYNPRNENVSIYRNFARNYRKILDSY